MMNIIALAKAMVLLMVTVLLPYQALGGGEPSSQEQILGNWEIIKAVTPKKEILPLDGQEYNIRFMADSRIHMKFETNLINGEFEVEGMNLRLKQPLMMTMAAWLPDSPAPRFVQLMENATIYFFKDGLLFIDTFADGGTLHLRRVME